jgi:putative aldouronate transport system permease protein
MSFLKGYSIANGWGWVISANYSVILHSEMLFPIRLYMNRGEAFSPIMLFKTISTAGNKMGIAFNDPIILEFGTIISLPSILLLLIFRKLLTSEVFISQSRKL